MFENKSLPQEEFLPKISLKKFLPNILKSFPPTDSKEKLAQKKTLWREISTKYNSLETSTTKHLTTQFLPKISKEKSLPNNAQQKISTKQNLFGRG